MAPDSVMIGGSTPRRGGFVSIIESPLGYRRRGLAEGSNIHSSEGCTPCSITGRGRARAVSHEASKSCFSRFRGLPGGIAAFRHSIVTHGKDKKGSGVFSHDPLGRPRGRSVHSTSNRLAVRRTPSSSPKGRPRCTLSFCQKITSDQLNRPLTLEK